MSGQSFPEKTPLASLQAPGDGGVETGFQGRKKLQVIGLMLLVGFVGNWMPLGGLLAGGIAAVVWIAWEKTLPASATKRGVVAGLLAGIGEFLAGGIVTSINLFKNTGPASNSILVSTFLIIYLPLAILAILTGAFTGYLFGRKGKIDQDRVAKIEIAKPAPAAIRSAPPLSAPGRTQLRCCICDKDLTGLPAMVDHATGEAFCEHDAHYFGMHPSNRPKRPTIQAPTKTATNYSGYSRAVIYCRVGFPTSSLRLPGFAGEADVVRAGSSVGETEIITAMLRRGCDKDNILVSTPDYGVGFIK